MNRIEVYFQSIRNNQKALEDFFEKMPKGADIHHHALGAIWPEDVLETALDMDLWVDTKTGHLYKEPAMAWYKVDELIRQEESRMTLLSQWSVLNHNKDASLPHEHFFGVFPKLEAVFVGNEACWLHKIAATAAAEQLLYIETLIEIPRLRRKLCLQANTYTKWPENPEDTDFELFYSYLKNKELDGLVAELCAEINDWQSALNSNKTPKAALGYQLYAIRTMEPMEVFAQLIAYFEAATQSPHIVGVNLVAPEYAPNALAHYHLHMCMCRWLKKRYPEVNLALHAGELTAEMVEASQLSFHIYEAIEIAGAQRIGHGVDLLSETNSGRILELMQAKQIALEVLPDSNYFILDVSGNRHPLMTYLRAGVPLVLATDDPGLLRCSLSQQFIRIARDYPAITYRHLKEMAFNSLRYSFLVEATKNILLEKLEQQFSSFERNIILP